MISRHASLSDVAELVRVINVAYLVEADMFHGTRTTDADVRERLAMPNAVFLAFDDPDRPGTVAGTVFVETNGDRGYFGMLAVDPELQGRGLGRALVTAAEVYCRSVDCKALDLDVVDLRGELTAFYASLGYTVIGDSPYGRPELTKQPVRLIHMTKSLAT